MLQAEKEILIVAGEASADRYGARLIRKLQQQTAPAGLSFFGTGGDEIQGAGARLICHIRDLANIGPHAASANLRKYFEVYRRITRACDARPPAVAVLIDFPEFNLRLLRRLKRAGTRVIYYVGPQLWAWRRGRVRLIRRHVDRLAVILPFEVEFYRRHGVKAEFVGHPLLEDFAPYKDRDAFLRSVGLDHRLPALGLLPGSRRHEVEHILPTMLRASLRVMERAQAQFLVSVAPTIDDAQVARIMAEVLGGLSRPEFRMVKGRSLDVLACSDFAFVKSGTSTLEAALAGTPFLITYKVAPLSWMIGNILIRSRLKGLVNLLVGEEIVPELLQGKASPEALAAVAREYLEAPQMAEAMRARLARIREVLGGRSASESVAAMVVDCL